MSDQSLILGTAGHIDHGKSSLVNMLTGVDPDRLSEEKERGITIQLGFAQLELPTGRKMGVVDVPGHERFVRQMIAGATGIDVALIVIAADDGIMPQTREHVSIMELLGITDAVVALTKADLVDEEWLALVRADVEELLSDTVFSSAPIVPVSSRTSVGKDELLAAIDEVASHTTRALSAELSPRMPIDRVFSLTGVGTVVTGTLWSGTFAPDDQVMLFPGEKPARIRSIQVHDTDVERAYPGQRVALNLSGVEKDEVSRGDMVAAPGSLEEHDRVDVDFVYLGKPGSDAPFVSGSRVHVNHGTTEAVGRILLMNGVEKLMPGETSLAQIRLESPLMLRSRDRFIVRSYSPVTLIGGGTVLYTSPLHRTRLEDDVNELLGALSEADDSRSVHAYFKVIDTPWSAERIARSLDMTGDRVLESIKTASDDLVVIPVEGVDHFIREDRLAVLEDSIEAGLRKFHDDEPNATDITTVALRDRVDRRLPVEVFDAIVRRMAEAGNVIMQRGRVSHPESSARAQEAATETAERLYAAVDADLAPPFFRDLLAAEGLDEKVARSVLVGLMESGRVIRIDSDYLLSDNRFVEAQERITRAIPAGGSAPLGPIKDSLGLSRKYLVPLLEYMDRIRFTVREGDERRLGK